MNNLTISIEAGKSILLETAGMLCDKNIIISTTSGGVNLPTLTDEGSASDLLFGKQLISSEGNVVDGTFTIDEELTAQDNLIAQIQTALEGKSAGGVVLPTLTNPATSADILKGKEAIDENGNEMVGTLVPSSGGKACLVNLDISALPSGGFMPTIIQVYYLLPDGSMPGEVLQLNPSDGDKPILEVQVGFLILADIYGSGAFYSGLQPQLSGGVNFEFGADTAIIFKIEDDCTISFA